MELDRRELYKLRRHKDPTSAVSNTTSGLTSIVLTLLPVVETLQMRQSNDSQLSVLESPKRLSDSKPQL